MASSKIHMDEVMDDDDNTFVIILGLIAAICEIVVLFL